MKIIILLCILIAFCSSQGNFYHTLQAEAAKSNGWIPGNFGQYVNGISVKVASVSNSLNRNTLDSILGLGVPQDIVNFFKQCSSGTNTYNTYAITGMTGCTSREWVEFILRETTRNFRIWKEVQEEMV